MLYPQPGTCEDFLLGETKLCLTAVAEKWLLCTMFLFGMWLLPSNPSNKFKHFVQQPFSRTFNVGPGWARPAVMKLILDMAWLAPMLFAKLISTNGECWTPQQNLRCLFFPVVERSQWGGTLLPLKHYSTTGKMGQLQTGLLSWVCCEIGYSTCDLNFHWQLHPVL